MNKRIFELLKQATTDINPQDREWVFSRVDQAKFAELLVREFAALAKSKSEHIEGIKTEDHDDQVLLHSLAWRFKEFEYEIKKHFGVES